jgi:hypothetical protein
MQRSSSNPHPHPNPNPNRVGTSCDAVFKFIEEAPGRFATDPEKVILLGFSQGATMVWTAHCSFCEENNICTRGWHLAGLKTACVQPNTTPSGYPLSYWRYLTLCCNTAGTVAQMAAPTLHLCQCCDFRPFDASTAAGRCDAQRTIGTAFAARAC